MYDDLREQLSAAAATTSPSPRGGGPGARGDRGVRPCGAASLPVCSCIRCAASTTGPASRTPRLRGRGACDSSYLAECVITDRDRRLAAGCRACAVAGRRTWRPRGSASSHLRATGCATVWRRAGSEVLHRGRCRRDRRAPGHDRPEDGLRPGSVAAPATRRWPPLTPSAGWGLPAGPSCRWPRSGSRATAASSSCATWSLVDPLRSRPGEASCGCAGSTAASAVPECQIGLPGPGGRRIYLDLGLRAERFAAEYDGAAFHGEDQRDARRGPPRVGAVRAGWAIVVVRAAQPPRSTPGRRPALRRGAPTGPEMPLTRP